MADNTLTDEEALIELKRILERLPKKQCQIVEVESASAPISESATELTSTPDNTDHDSNQSAAEAADTPSLSIVVRGPSLYDYLAPLIGWFRRYIAPIFVARAAASQHPMTGAIQSRVAIIDPSLDHYISSAEMVGAGTRAEIMELTPAIEKYMAEVQIKNRGFADIRANVTRPPGIMNAANIYETLLWYNGTYPRAQIDPDIVLCHILAICHNFAVVRAIVIYNIDSAGIYHILYKYENQSYGRMIKVFPHVDSDSCWNVYAIRVHIPV